MGVVFLFRTISVSQKHIDRCDKTEEWYGVRYSIEKHTSEQEKMWKECGTHKELQLPARNEFIPHDFELVERDPAHSQSPRVIRVSHFLLALWGCLSQLHAKYSSSKRLC